MTRYKKYLISCLFISIFCFVVSMPQARKFRDNIANLTSALATITTANVTTLTATTGTVTTLTSTSGTITDLNSSTGDITVDTVTATTGTVTDLTAPTTTVGTSLTVGTNGTAISGILHGTTTVSNGGTTNSLSLTGVASSDKVFYGISSGNTNAVAVESAVPSTDAVLVTLASDPGADTDVDVLVIK